MNVTELNCIASIGGLLLVSGKVESNYIHLYPGSHKPIYADEINDLDIRPLAFEKFIQTIDPNGQSAPRWDLPDVVFKSMRPYSFESPKKVLCLGWKFRFIGRSFGRAHNEDGGYLEGAKAVRVLTVMPVSFNDQRYRKPFDVLPSQVIGRVKLYAEIGEKDIGA